MKKISLILVFALVVSMLAGCAASGTEGDAPQDDRDPSAGGNVNTPSGGTDSGEDAAQIVLSPDGVSLNGEPLGEDPASPAYVARDIVYYMSGQGAATARAPRMTPTARMRPGRIWCST